MRKYTLKFNQENRDIFESIRLGSKKVETRAATVKYKDIQKGDELVFVCGKEKFSKHVKKVAVFKSISAILKKYKPSQINPSLKTVKETEELYHSFPGYKEKIKTYGLIAFELD